MPAENFAIKTGKHPSEVTKKNIKTFKRQIKSLGFSYDWSREINTTDPKYYKWTQWIFLKLFKRGLAYQAEAPINWCPSCKTGLANEEVVNGKCERCGIATTQKNIRQWILKITEYADRLLEDLDKLDWPEPIKLMQRNWIGKSEGATVEFSTLPTGRQVFNFQFSINVFTTRPDTLFGATFMVLAPEHELVKKLKSQIKNWSEVEKYIDNAKKKSDLERTDLAKEKTGVELKGVQAINPVNNKKIPIWIADYVLASYGTGAIMAVPAHDERDWEFAKKYNIPIKQVVAPFFKTTTGKDAVKEKQKDVRRDVVYVFVKHHTENKYLCLNWKGQGWHSTIIGGLEKNESVIEAAKREVQEETGYKNVKLIRKFDTEMHNHFFAGHKNENRYAVGHAVIFELVDNKQDKVSEKEKKIHDVLWIDTKNMERFLNLENYHFMWNMVRHNLDCFTGEGIAINSGEFSGLTTQEFKKKITKWLSEKNLGKKAVNYKLRDWVFSRQRYWGEPIPVYHCEKCGSTPASEKEVLTTNKWQLPNVKNYQPTGTEESPLANIKDWVNTKCPKCGGPAKRETNTMPQWAGSCWYYLRYLDPKNNKELATKEKLKHWLPVDLYIGGAEHAVLHLLYARFWHKVLYDEGIVPTKEPFQKLINQGMILGEDNQKMSKSRGNVINPDEVIEKHGADTLRLYEMFMGPLEDVKPWSTKGVIGARRFLDKVWRYYFDWDDDRNRRTTKEEKYSDPKTQKIHNSNIKREVKYYGGDYTGDDKVDSLLEKTIKKVGEDIENFKFNTAISQMMIYINEICKEYYDEGGKKNAERKIWITTNQLEKFLKILSPFSPHITEELWQKIGNKESIFKQKWPAYDKKLIQENEIELVIQINGKVRDKIQVAAGITQERAMEIVEKSKKVQKWVGNKEFKKIIFIKGKLLNIVI